MDTCEISQAQIKRAERVLVQCAERVAATMQSRTFPSYWNWRKALNVSLAVAVSRHCSKILQATSSPQSSEFRAGVVVEERRQQRAALASELRNSRRRLRKLEAEIEISGRLLAQSASSVALQHERPKIPAQSVPATKDGRGLPGTPGIYFVWEDGVIVYVGQASVLSRRATLGHQVIGANSKLSWIETPRANLNFLESFYIGLTCPPRNFGRRAGHLLE